MKVLLTAVGGDVGQSVIKCLKDTKYRPFLVGCDCNPCAGGREDVDIFLQSPPVSESQSYTDFLWKTIQTFQVQYVFPLSEPEILFLHNRRSQFQDSPAHFFIQSAALVETFMDKYKTSLYLKSQSLPYPQTWLQEEYDGQLDYPLVLKKRRGSGGRGFVEIRDYEELHFYISRQRGMIVQEYLPDENNEYTAGLFSDGRTKYSIAFKRQLAPGGFSQQVELAGNRQITLFLRNLLNVLDFHGSLNVQFRLTKRGCVPFEINPRFSSTVYFRHLFGFKDVQWSLDVNRGEFVHYSGPIRKGVGVRKFNEVVFNNEREK